MTIVVREHAVVDASELPGYAFGHRSLLWWGTLGFIATEGTAFALAAFAYFYLRHKSGTWPPNLPPPDMLWGTVNLAILLASCAPNQWVKRAAEREAIGPVRIGLLVMTLLGLAPLVVRWFEFPSMLCQWDTNAYCSINWALLFLHTVHILTDFADTAVLTALMFTRHGRGKRFVDVSENAFYWYFVVLSWIPIWAILYLVPRLG
jgi:cytochrome c oxidase subunit III